MTEQETFVWEYVNRKMKKHDLPYGMAYYNLLSNVIDKAERAWQKKQKAELKK